MGTKPLKTTRADRRLKQNKHLPPYEDNFRHIKNKRTPVEPLIKDYSGNTHIRTVPDKDDTK